MRLWLCPLALGTFWWGCAGDEASPASTTPSPDAGSSPDGATDAAGSSSDAQNETETGGPPPCLLDQPFDAPVPFEAVNSDQDDFDLRFSKDAEFAVFARGGPGGNSFDIMIAAKTDNYGGGKPLVGVNGASGCCADNAPSVSPDGLEIFFHTNDQPPTPYAADARIWHATRANANASFGARSLVPGLEDRKAYKPLLTHDGNALYFRDLNLNRLVRTSRIAGQWGTPQEMVQGEVWTSAVDGQERTLYVSRGNGKIYVSRRASVVEPWSEPVLVTELGDGYPSYLSADGCTLYFDGTRNHPNGRAGTNVWVARKKKP